MFTGIIEQIGIVKRAAPHAGGMRLRVQTGPMADQCRPGASVCVSGACLTVAEAEADALEFDVITETLQRSTLGSLRVGDRVNLERSLRVGDRLDGHFVQGHVDGKGTVARVESTPNHHVVWLEVGSDLAPYMIPKGSVAVDGVSLTIASCHENRFAVALIPTTLRNTTLRDRRSGDLVNIETDIIARTIVRRLEALREPRGLTMAKLEEAGYA